MIQKYTDKERAAIKEEYLQGRSLGYLAAKYAKDKFKADSQKPRIRQLLVEQGVRIRKKNERVNKNPLKTIQKRKDTQLKLLHEIRFLLTQVSEQLRLPEKKG